MADDPWTRLYFDLSPYTGSVFNITLQSACRFSDKAQGEGDNVFIDNISITNTTITGSKEPGKEIITVYPNPSDGRIKVTASPVENQAVITVSSMIGNTVYSKKVTSENGEMHENLDLSFLPQGVYMLSINDSSKQLNQRFVIR
jgi:hypothetical protein